MTRESFTFLVLTLATILALPAAKAADVYVVAGQSNGYRLSSLAQGETPIPGGHRI